jgi:hypothetical protein
MIKNRNSLSFIQLNDSHADFYLHQEMFWQAGRAGTEVCLEADG